MPRQLPVEIRRLYTPTRVDKKHVMGPGWMLKCDGCGERSHLPHPPDGSDFNPDLIRHLLDHAATHYNIPLAPTSVPSIAPVRTPPKLHVVKSLPTQKAIIPHIQEVPTKGYYRVIREGGYHKMVPVSYTEYQNGEVQQVGDSYTVVVKGVNAKHARIVAEGLIDRHIRPPRPTRSWRGKVSNS